MIKKLIKGSLARAGLQISPILSESVRDNNPDITDMEWEIYSMVHGYTMLSVEGILANIRAVDHISRSRIARRHCGMWCVARWQFDGNGVSLDSPTRYLAHSLDVRYVRGHDRCD
jgi:hypothetical protein